MSPPFSYEGLHYERWHEWRLPVLAQFAGALLPFVYAAMSWLLLARAWRRRMA